MSRSLSWLIWEARECLEAGAGDKQWDIIIAQLSHTPQSKEGARAHSNQVKEVKKMIDEPLRAAKSRESRNKPVESKSWIKLEQGERAEDFA
jgi:hypothetical protein